MYAGAEKEFGGGVEGESHHDVLKQNFEYKHLSHESMGKLPVYQRHNPPVIGSPEDQ